MKTGDWIYSAALQGEVLGVIYRVHHFEQIFSCWPLGLYIYGRNTYSKYASQFSNFLFEMSAELIVEPSGVSVFRTTTSRILL